MKYNQKKECPFVEGEIAVFTSSYRFETYISRVQGIHVYNYGECWLPEIRKATVDEKRRYFESGKHELIIDDFYKKYEQDITTTQ